MTAPAGPDPSGAARAHVFDATRCTLGEGPLWHPERGQLYWFDILARRLLTREGGATRHWDFDDIVSAAGWVSDTALLIASETRLFRFDPTSGAHETVAPLEADRADTRPNDGRADPWGGFWISTMGKRAERDAGAIYRYYRGEMRRLIAPLTIPNGIAFAPDRSVAYAADTLRRQVWRVPLAAQDGWPSGPPEPFLDLFGQGLNPDGAVTDAAGNYWSAHWGAGRVACYAPDGRLMTTLHVPARQPSCPAFGGADLTTLFVTSALENLGPETRDDPAENGMTFAVAGVGPGLPEPKVVL